MFGIDTRALRIVWTTFLFLFAVLLVYRLSGTIVVFTLAIFLAHFLGPIAARLERAIPVTWGQPRVALAAVYLALVGVLIGILIPLVGEVGNQASALAQQLPTALATDPFGQFPLPTWLEPLRERLTLTLRDSFAGFDQQLVPMLESIGASIGGVMGVALAIVLIPILSFFFLKDGREIRTALVDFVPSEYRTVADEILLDLNRLLILYLRALVMLALIVLIVFTLFLNATGVPFASLLAVAAALLEVIPVAGPLVAGVLIVVTAIVSGYTHPVLLLVFLVVFRLIQDYVISPHLLAAGVEIHPLWVLFGVLAGEQLAGIPGMFFSVPVMAALRIVVVRMRRNNVTPDVIVK